MTNLHDLTVDELADGICLRAGRIAAAEAELLAWIAEFDRREGWAGPGLLSCADWLSWRTGLSPGAARERVRVARRLDELPDLAAALGDGRVSYSKVRALTRVAQPGDGTDWVGLARCSSASQLERLVRGVERARAAELAEADPEAAAGPLRTTLRYDEHGGFTLTVKGPAEYAPVVRAGLDARKAQLQRERREAAASEPGTRVEAPPPAAPAQRVATAATALPPEERRGPGATPDDDSAPAAAPVTDADALLALAEDALAAEEADRPHLARRRRPQLTAQVDPLFGWVRQADGELLPPTGLRTVMTGPHGRAGVVRLRPVTAADLRRADLGRTQRGPSAMLRSLLGALDGERCRFPGCRRHRKLHAHHVVPWSRGGPTDLANLVLVCGRHHTLVHAQGFRLVLHPDRRLAVSTSDGVPVLHHPDQPWGDPAALAQGCGRRVSAETLPPEHCDARLDLRYAVSVLMAQAA